MTKDLNPKSWTNFSYLTRSIKAENQYFNYILTEAYRGKTTNIVTLSNKLWTVDGLFYSFLKPPTFSVHVSLLL